MATHGTTKALLLTNIYNPLTSLKYIGFYNIHRKNEQRDSSPSAISKMNYIIQIANQAGVDVSIISPSWLSSSKKIWSITKKTFINRKTVLVEMFNFSPRFKFVRVLNIIMSLLHLFFYVLIKCKKDEKILVYHSPWLVVPLFFAKKIKNFYLILEVEEVYGDVLSIHPYIDIFEKKIFDCADSFIFSNDLLKNILTKNKPSIVLYGNYSTYDTKPSTINNQKIRVLYAGIIDHEKRGAFNAIEAAAFLSADYEMFVAGFGDVVALETRINEINLIAKCKISFVGNLQGEDYLSFCQSCDIGLSTQNMAGRYVDSSFPSKILSYLGMGLEVVSCAIKCVQSSDIGKIVNYYNIDKPQMIANTIMSVKTNQKKAILQKMNELNSKFAVELKLLLKN